MEIIIDVREKSTNAAENPTAFLLGFCKTWPELFPNDSISLLGKIPMPETDQIRVINIPDRYEHRGNRLSEKYFYDFRLPSILKSKPEAIFLSFSGQASLSLKNPQVFLSGYFSGHDGQVSNLIPNRFRFRKIAERLKAVVFATGYEKNSIEKMYPKITGKSNLIFPPVTENPGEWSELQKEASLARFAGGKEYFLWESNEVTELLFTSVLKGFSAFKKRQQTNMQLVLAGSAFQRKELIHLLQGFKYKADVHHPGSLTNEEENALCRSAYAILFPSAGAETERKMMLAMLRRIPMLCADMSLLKNLAGSNALFFDPDNPDDINRQLSIIFKNENHRSELSQLAFQQVTRHNRTYVLKAIREILQGLQGGAGIP